MTRERIEDIREIVLPFVRQRLIEINYENLGESDAKEFENDFNEILNLAIKALEVVAENATTEQFGNSEELGTPKKNLAVAEQELCEDCVSRKDIYFKLTNGAYSNETIEQFIDRLVKELEALPPVKPQEPKTQFVEKSNFDIRQYNADLQNAYDCGKASQEPKTGHWINDEDTIGCYYCSECGGYVASYDDAYCKYCGCRMSEVSE